MYFDKVYLNQAQNIYLKRVDNVIIQLLQKMALLFNLIIGYCLYSLTTDCWFMIVNDSLLTD